MQEFAPRGTASPDRHTLIPAHLRFVKAPDQRRQHMRALQIKVVARTIKVRRHQGYGTKAILAAKSLAHLDARDLGDGIPLVGGLERTGEQVLLLDRLRRELRIDAARAQKHELADPRAMGRIDHIVLHQRLSRMNKAGWELLAWIPPTRAAAMMTASGRSASKNSRDPRLGRSDRVPRACER